MRPRTPQPLARCRGDDGFGGSIDMLFVWVISIGLFLLIFELAAYWHIRNTLEQAGAEGARTAALYNGDCNQAITAATSQAARQGGWTNNVNVDCTTTTDRTIVRVTATSWSIAFGHATITIATVIGEIPER